MGNSHSIGSADDDIKWLNMTHQNIFDDKFLQNAAEDLQEIDLPSPQEKDTDGDDNVLSPFITEKIQCLASLFSESSHSTTPTIRSCNSLSVSKATSCDDTPFFLMNRKRYQLLIRIHLAHLRQRNQSSRHLLNKSLISGLRLEGSREGGGIEDSGKDMLTEASVSMSLAILETLGPTHPQLFKKISSNLITLFDGCNSSSSSTSSLSNTGLDTILSFAESALSNHPESRKEALALMFSTAVATGSLSGVLKSVLNLLEGPDDLADNAHHAIKSLEQLTEAPPLDQTKTSANDVHGTVHAKVEMPIDKIEIKNYESACSTDGRFMFVWHGLDHSLHKIGTGFHHSIAGNEYKKNLSVCEDLVSYLGRDVYNVAEGIKELNNLKEKHFVQGWIACIADKLFLRLENDDILGPYRVAVFDCGSLELKDVLDIDIPLHSFVVARRLWLSKRSWTGEDVILPTNDTTSDDSIEWDYAAERSNILFISSQEGSAQSDIATPLLAWDTDISSSALRFADNNTRAMRDGSAGCYPCSNIKVTGTLVTMTCQLEAAPITRNKMSVGIALAAHEGSTFGDTLSSWGISHEAGQSGRFRSKDAAVGETVRQLQDGDQYRLRYDPSDGTMLLMLDSANGDFSNPEAKHLFNIHEPGEVVDLVVGASYANDCQLTLLNNTAVLPASGADSPKVASHEMASITTSDFSRIDAELTADLFCEEASSRMGFSFDPRDVDQELTISLAQSCRISRVGSIFSAIELSSSDNVSSMPPGMSVYVSSDGVEYALLGETPGSDINEGEVSFVDVPKPEAATSECKLYDKVKYLRLKYHNVSIISHIVVLGFVMKPKPIVAPILPMTTDGKHLLFLHINDSRESMKLETFTLDPSQSMTLVHRAEYDMSRFPPKLLETYQASLLLKCSFVFNSNYLLISFRDSDRPRSKKDKSISYGFIKYDCISSNVLSTHFYTFEKETSFPSAMCFDMRNNMIWGWCANSCKFIRWRCQGLAPRFTSTVPSSNSDELLLSAHPQFRLKALKSRYHMNQGDDFHKKGAFILGLLGELSFIYGPPDWVGAENEMKNELHASSIWDKKIDECEFLVRGQKQHKCSDGFNLLCLDDEFNSKSFHNFDTTSDASASEDMCNFINNDVKLGTMVLVVSMGYASKHFTSQAKTALYLLGATGLEAFGKDISFCMIGMKGALPDAVVQKISDKPQISVIVTQRVPTIKAPFRFESSDSVFHMLATLVSRYYQMFKSGDACDILDTNILLSALSILTTNVFQLQSNETPIRALEIFAEQDRTLIKSVIGDILDHLPLHTHGCAVVVSMVLRLSIIGIDLFCPSGEEKIASLTRYLHLANASDFHMEDSVLEALMQQFTPAFFVSCCGNSCVNLLDLFVQLLQITEDSTKQMFHNFVRRIKSPLSVKLSEQQEAVGNDPTRMFSRKNKYSVEKAALELLYTLCNVLMSYHSQLIVEAASPAGCSAAIDSVFSLFATIINSSAEIFTNSLQSIEKAMLMDLTRTTEELSEDVLSIIESSSVYSIFPMITSSVSLLFDQYGDKLLHHVTPLLISSMKKCSTVFNAVKSKLPSLRSYVVLPTARQESHMFESEHPYQPNMRETFTLNYPGASKMTVTFDEKSRTEPNTDFVRIWKDSSKTETWHPHLSKLTGRRSSTKWPGVKDEPPLEIDSSTAFVEFYTDSSDEDWGWKFEVLVDFNGGSSATYHWLINIDNQFNHCLAVVASCLVSSTPWVSDLDNSHIGWLTDPLFAAGFVSQTRQDDCISTVKSYGFRNDEEDAFLNDFLDRPEGSLALTFCQLMKAFVMEDQGSHELRNRAVYMACAVIIQHNDLASEALYLAKADPDENQHPSSALIDAWKCGQCLRSFLNFGQVEATEDENLLAAPSLERGPSVYNEAKDTEIVRRVVNQIIARAKCLLCLQSSTDIDVNIVLNEFNRDETCCDSSLPELGASFQRAISGDMQVYQARQAATLKETEASTDSLIKKKSLNISEKIIRFLKGNINIKELNRVCSLRSERAAIRSLGLILVSTLAASDSLLWVRHVTASYMMPFHHPTSSEVHYLNAIEGCSSQDKRRVMSSFLAYISTCVKTIIRSTANFQNHQLFSSTERADWKEITICCLKGLCLDFSWSDFLFLQNTRVLSVLQTTIRTSDAEVTSATIFVIKFLLSRYLYVENQERLLHPFQAYAAPSSFKKQLFSLVIDVLNLATGLSEEKDTVQFEDVAMRSSVEGCSVLLADSVTLSKDTLGYRIAPLRIGLQHSFAMWIRRPRRPFDDAMGEVIACSQDGSSSSNVSKWFEIGSKLRGMQVVKGPDWLESDGAVDSCPSSKTINNTLGVIDKFDPKTRTVTVQWHDDDQKDLKKKEKVRKTYLFGAVEEGEMKFQVSLADEEVRGHLYSKGMNSCQTKSEENKCWSVLGLQINSDGKLQTFMMKNEEKQCFAQTLSPLPPDVWTHVCVVQDCARTLFYYNGVLDSQTEIDDDKLFDESSIEIERLSTKWNEAPIYIGQTPFYINNTEEMSSFVGSIQDFCVHSSKALSASEVKDVMREKEGNLAPMIDEGFRLQAIELLYKEASALRDFVSILMQDQFVIDMLLEPLFFMLKRGSATTKCGVLRLCVTLLPAFSEEVVNQAAHQAGLILSSQSFLDFLFEEVGQLLNSQHEYEQTMARPCAEMEHTVGIEYVRLLSSLARNSQYCDYVGERVERIIASVNSSWDTCSDYNSLLAVLALCGGNVLDLCGGCNGRYQTSSSSHIDEKGGNTTASGGMMEDCIILAPTWPPSKETLDLKWKGKEQELEAKEEFSLWADKHSFSDAFFIALSSQPFSPIIVPRDKIFASPMTQLGKIESFLKNHLSSLVTLFTGIIRMSASSGHRQGSVDNMQQSTRVAHLKLVGMVAFNKLLKTFSWFALNSASLLRSLVDVTLLPIPARPIPPTPPPVKPVVMESKHDYDHNVNVYYPVKLPGAKSLLITFDPESRTERNYDYLRFYHDDSHTKHYGEEKYSGGRGSWPGTGSTPALVIPSDSVVIYWRTDSSGNDWGWKLKISVNEYKIPKQSDVGFLDPGQCRHFLRYLHMAQRDTHVQSILCRDEELERESIVEDIAATEKHVKTDKHTQNDDTSSSIDVFGMLKSAGQRRRRLYPIGQRQLRANVSHVSGNQLTLRKEACDSSDVLHTLSDVKNCVFDVHHYQDNWVFVSCSQHLHIHPSSGGWLRRRVDEIETLVPCTPVDDNTELIDFEDVLYCNNSVPKQVIATKVRIEDKHSSNPMFEVDEKKSQIDSLLDSFSESPVQLVHSNMATLLPSIRSISMMCSLSLAQDCIATIFSVLPENEQRFMDCFESPTRLLAYIKTLHIRNTHNTGSNVSLSGDKFNAVVNILKQYESRHGSKGETWRSLLNYSLNELWFLILRDASSGMPPSAGVKQELLVTSEGAGAGAEVKCSICNTSESLHGINRSIFSSAADEYTGEVTVPGAQFLTVMLADDTEIPEDAGVLMVGSESLTAQSKVTPIVILGDKYKVTWKPRSNGSPSIWQCRIACYAQMTGPSLKLRAAFRKRCAPGEKLSIDLACWLLKFLSRDNLPEIQSRLYSVETIACLRKCINVIKSPENQQEVVHLILTMFSKTPGDLSAESSEEVKRLTDKVISLCEKQKQVEGSKGISQYLQTLIECSLVMSDYLTELKIQSNCVVWEEGRGSVLTYTAEGDQLDAYSRVVFAKQTFCEKDSRTFHVRLNSVLNEACGACVGVMSGSGTRFDFNTLRGEGSAFAVAWTKQTLFVCHPRSDNSATMQVTKLPFGPELFPADIVSVEVNMREQCIVFYRNSVFVGVALGPVGSGATFELDLTTVPGPLCFTGSVKSPQESLLLLQSLSSSAVQSSKPLALADELPTWLKSMQEAVRILQASQQHTIPRPVLVEEFLPLCRKKAQVSLLFDSFRQNLSRDVSIPYADFLSVSLDDALLKGSSARISIKTPVTGSSSDQNDVELLYMQVEEHMKVDRTLPLFTPRTPLTKVKRFRHAGCAALRTHDPETDTDQCAACGGAFKAGLESSIAIPKEPVEPCLSRPPASSFIICTEHSCPLEESGMRVDRSEATCDCCGIDDEDASRYFCEECDFDICADCFEPENSFFPSSANSCKISEPPPVGRVVSLDPSCLSCADTQSGKLKNVLDYTGSSYWECANSTGFGAASGMSSCINMLLSASILKDLGDEYHLEMYNNNFGGAYDPDCVKVKVDGTVANTVDHFRLEESWVRILSSAQLETHRAASGGDDVKINIYFRSDGCNFKVCGLRFVSTREFTKVLFCSALCEQYGVESGCITSDDESEGRKLIEGDVVVRGPDWRWGDEDGGAGCLGTVTEVTSWAGESSAGVRVKWQRSGHEGLYRWNDSISDAFDVSLVRNSYEMNRTLSIPGNKMTFELDSAVINLDDKERNDPCVPWLGCPSFNGTSSVMQLPYSRDMDLSEDYTIEAWVRISEDTKAEVTTMPIVSRCIKTDESAMTDNFTLSVTFPSSGIEGKGVDKVLKCSSGHDMQTIPSGSKHPKYSCGYAVCNICSCHTDSQKDTYFCEICDYDLCNACGQRNLLFRPKCHAQHVTEILAAGADPVAYACYGSGAAECDMCGRSSLKLTGQVNYHCAFCQFDMCFECGEKERKMNLVGSSSTTSCSISRSSRSSSSRVGNESSTPLVPSCSQGHTMVQVEDSRDFRMYKCGVCLHEKPYSVDEVTYHCEECLFELCQDCSEMSIFCKAYPDFKLKCPDGHRYTPRESSATTATVAVNCHHCLTQINDSTYHECEQCKCFLCQICAIHEFTRVHPRVNRDEDFAQLSDNMMYYCGREKGECRCGQCDSFCGPSDGCPCDACLELSSLNVIMSPLEYHARVRRGKSFETEHIGLIYCETLFKYSKIEDNWAKLDPCEYKRLSISDHFQTHNPEEEGWCALHAQDNDQILYRKGYYALPIYDRSPSPTDKRTASLTLTVLNSEMKTGIEITGGDVYAGQWTHVSAVMAGDTATLLVNGVKVGASATFQGPRGTCEGTPLLLGGSAEKTSSLHGHLFDVRLWNVARSTDEIQKHKDMPLLRRKSGDEVAGLFASLLLRNDDDDDAAISSSVEQRQPEDIQTYPESMKKTEVSQPMNGIIELPEMSHDVIWDTSVEPAKALLKEANSVLKCLITPQFSIDTILQENLFSTELQQFKNQYVTSKLKDDKVMVCFVNAIANEKKVDIHYLLKCDWHSLSPTGHDRRSMQLMSEFERINATPPADGSESSANDRFKVLQRLNKALLVAIPYFDLCTMTTPGTLSHLLCSFRGVIFNLTKEKFWAEALVSTGTSSERFKLSISRSRATKHAMTGIPDHGGKMMVFSQAFRQIHPLPPVRLRRKGQLYNTVFMGEHSNDAGGPYSESFAMMCLELQSPSLPLLVRTRNGIGNIGQNKEKWVFNPAATSNLHLEMFSFLGKLMGIAIRSKEYLGLNISSIIWKLLVRDVPNRKDLEGINISYIQSLDRIREYEEETIACLEQTFTLTTWDNKEVELIPGGSQEIVTLASRDRYCDLCEQYCLHEFDEQAAATRQGLGSIVPPHLLSLYTWQELDYMVCGNPIIDVALLEAMTTYQGCSSSDEHIRNFWKVLQEYSEEEKSSFLRFTWGRSRLPLTRDGFSRKLKIEQFTSRGRSSATQDESLPVSHTCFFSLELPKYSSLEILREKLTYAINNCVAIDVDTDSTGMSAAGMGWEEF